MRIPSLLCGILAAFALAAQAGPDAESGGPYPVGTQGNWGREPYRTGSWSAMDRVAGLAIRTVPRGAGPVAPLPRASQPPAIRYRYRNTEHSLDDYLERQRVSALLILRHGEIVTEQRRRGRGEDARYLSFSMAKSVVSLLVGVALERGLIASLDDSAATYAQELAGSAYGATPLRALLRMGSGLAFSERYDGHDDVARMGRAAATGSPSVLQVLRSVEQREAPAGSRFAYASAETEVLGRVLAAASGRSLAELSAQWLWQPLGAEQDAFWVLAREGTERASGYFNASLRDWGRLGLLLARDGRSTAAPGAEEVQIVPREYLLDATDAARQPAAFRPRQATPYLGYGFQFWLLPLKTRSFALLGVHGQAVFVQPASGIVMVHLATFEPASSRQDPAPFAERNALWRGVLQSLGGSTDE